jgi:hypothetical protein
MAILQLEGLRHVRHLIGTRTRDLPVRSVVPQHTTLQLAPYMVCSFDDTDEGYLGRKTGREDYGQRTGVRFPAGIVRI